MIGVVYDPLYASERCCRVCRSSITHDLDIDKISTRSIALIYASLITCSESYSSHVSSVPVGIVRVNTAIVAVLGAP